MFTALEGLDNDHPSTATRAWLGEALRLVIVGGIGSFVLTVLNTDTKQLPQSRQVFGARRIGEQTVMANAMESQGQDMDEEAADELMCRQGHELVAGLSLGPVVLPFKGDAIVITGDKAAIGDGDTVGVSTEIGEHGLGSGEGAFGIDHPFDLTQGSEIIGEYFCIGKMVVMAKELQVSCIMCCGQLLQKQSTEQS